MPTLNALLFSRSAETPRITRSPRFRRDGGALWLGVGLCLMTLLVLHRNGR